MQSLDVVPLMLSVNDPWLDASFFLKEVDSCFGAKIPSWDVIPPSERKSANPSWVTTTRAKPFSMRQSSQR